MGSSEVAALVGQVIAVLAPAAPYLRQAAGSAATEGGKALVQKAPALAEKVRGLFKRVNQPKGEQALDLFLDDPQTFEDALTKLLADVLVDHPEWAAEVQALLGDEGLQEVVATNESVVRRVSMVASGRVKQRLHADQKSWVEDIRFERR